MCFISVNTLQFIFKNFNKMFLSYLLICVWSHYPNILSLFRFNLFLGLMTLCISACMNAMQSENSFKKSMNVIAYTYYFKLYQSTITIFL